MLENATNLKKEIEKWLEVLHLFEKYAWKRINEEGFHVDSCVRVETDLFFYDYGARSFFVQDGRIFFRDKDIETLLQLKHNEKFEKLLTAAIETGDERLFKYIAIGLIKKKIMIVEEQKHRQEMLDWSWWGGKDPFGDENEPQWKDTGMVLYDGHLAGEAKLHPEEIGIKKGGTAKAETAKQKSRLEYNTKRIKNQGGFRNYGKQEAFNSEGCYFSLPDGSGLFRRRGKEGLSDVRS